MLSIQVELLPSYDDVLSRVAVAEHGSGWLAQCDETGQYVALNRQFVDALASVLLSINPNGSRVLEVCAGGGALASALRSRGVDMIATDVNPPIGAQEVVSLSTAIALKAYRPSVVLGSFVPVDARVHEAVLGNDTVQAYVVLGAQTGHEYGTGLPRLPAGWVCRPLPLVTSYFVCRHDVWLGNKRPLLKKGLASLLIRESTAATLNQLNG